MYRRLLKLWHVLREYGDRATGRHKGRLGRLVLRDKPWWYDVGIAERVLGVGEACSSCQGPRRRSVVEVFSKGVDGSWRSGLWVSSCKTSCRRRDRFDRRVGKACSSCRDPRTGGGEAVSGGATYGLVVNPPVGAATGVIGALAKLAAVAGASAPAGL